MTEIDFRADASLDLETPKYLELKDPLTDEAILDENGKPAFVTVYSAQSETFQRRAFRVQAKFKAKSRRGSKGELTFDEQREAEAQIYGAAFADEWRICRKQKDGTWKALDFPCTPENAVKWVLANPLYKKQIASMTDDIDAFVGDEAGNFTKEASSRSSKASKTE